MPLSTSVTFTSLLTTDHTFRSIYTITADSRVELSEPIAHGSSEDMEFAFANNNTGATDKVKAIFAGGDAEMLFEFYEGDPAATGIKRGQITAGGRSTDTIPASPTGADFVWPAFSGDTSLPESDGGGDWFDQQAGDITHVRITRQDDGSYESGGGTEDITARLSVYYNAT